MKMCLTCMLLHVPLHVVSNEIFFKKSIDGKTGIKSIIKQGVVNIGDAELIVLSFFQY